jgi:hypothetical protein
LRLTGADLRPSALRAVVLRAATLRRAAGLVRATLRRTDLCVLRTVDLTFLATRRRLRLLGDFRVAMMRFLLGKSASLAPGGGARYLEGP